MKSCFSLFWILIRPMSRASANTIGFGKQITIIRFAKLFSKCLHTKHTSQSLSVVLQHVRRSSYMMIVWIMRHHITPVPSRWFRPSEAQKGSQLRAECARTFVVVVVSDSQTSQSCARLSVEPTKHNAICTQPSLACAHTQYNLTTA